ncbi:MAG: NAD(P)/FAD-dependent oxidoreductase [Candidatus Nanopelagicales bacterium]
MAMPKVVILGAGFGGLTAARALSKHAEVVLIDRHNFQTFLPLLYQVSTAGLAADHVAYPIRGALRKTNVQFRMGTPEKLNAATSELTLKDGQVVKYDHLVIAMGSTTADFGIAGVKENALGMKTVGEALTIRSEVMRSYEEMCRQGNQDKLDIAIVGGGPTGVEMAGAFAELVRGPLRSDYADAANRVRVSIIEAGPRLVPSFSESLSTKTQKDLEKLGVTVLTNTSVKEVMPNSILTLDGNTIPANTTVWAAGVKGVPAMDQLHLPVTRGRIDVSSTLQVTGYENVWAIGDIAGAVGSDGMPLPMVAPVAMQQGRFLAKQIQALTAAKPLANFKYKDKGSMATIGRHKAIVEVKGIKISGPIAWLAWLWLHLFYILGGRNKIGTMADWTWNYLTFDRGNRHIMDSF